MYKIALLTIFMLTTLQSFAISLPYIDSRELNKLERLLLVENYSQFLLDLERIESNQKEKQYSLIIFEKFIQNFEAYADNLNDCIYAGWPSKRGSHGFCNPPDTTNEYKEFQELSQQLNLRDGNPVGFEECSSSEKMCNPILFGPVCAPFDTKYNRVRATSNCNNASKRTFPGGFDYKSYLQKNLEHQDADVLINKLDEQMDNLQKTANSVCNDPNKKQSKTAVCGILAHRLSEDFPYYPGAASSAKSSLQVGSEVSQKSSIENDEEKILSEDDLVELENEINALGLEIDRELVSQECTDPSVAVVTNKRYNTIKLMDAKGEFLSKEGSECIKKLKPLLDKRSMLLNKYETALSQLIPTGGVCSAEGDGSSEANNSLEKQVTEMNKTVAAKACEENPQKWTIAGCSKDFACMIGSSLFFGGPLDKVGAFVGKKLGFDPSCLSSQNNCVMKIVTAAVDVVWSFLKSIPDILVAIGDGVKKLGNKIYSWMPWVSDTEEKLSDANQAAMNVMEEDEESTLTKIGNFFTGIWDMLSSYVTDDLMCTEEGWETERFRSDAHCDAPFVSWKCLSCAAAMSGICNIVGAVGSEVLIGILTGGGATIAKTGARALSVGIKAGTRLALKSQMKGVLGTTLRLTGTGLTKTAALVKAPLLISKSVLGKSKVFLAAQKAKYVAVKNWVGRNSSKVVTPIIPKNKVVRNVLEIGAEQTGHIVKRTLKVTGKTLTFGFKLPMKILKGTGRILDPFKLGERGFALGYKAANGLIPGAQFLRIANFNYDLMHISEELSKVSKSQKAVDLGLELMNTANKQMDEWLKLAKSGRLTQEEFNQMQKVLLLNDEIRKISANSPKALARFDEVEKTFLQKQQQLKSLMGDGNFARYQKYSDESYGLLDKNSSRNLKTGKESKITDADVLRKNTNEVIITTKPNNEELLIVDEVDGNFVALNANGEEILISSGVFNKESAKYVHQTINSAKPEVRVASLNKYSAKNGKKALAQKKRQIKSMEDVNDSGGTLSAKKAKREIKRSLAAKDKNAIISNQAQQKQLMQEVDSYQASLQRKAAGTSSNKDMNLLAQEIKLLDEAKLIANPANKIKIDAYKQAIYDQLISNELRSTLANKVRGPASEIKFTSKQSNIGIVDKDGKVFRDSYDGAVTGTVDNSGAFIRIDKNTLSEGVRVIDETSTSFVGFDSQGRVLHIKKNSLDPKIRSAISENVATLSPKSKEKILKNIESGKQYRVYPKTNPDFIYSKQLAQSEIRVGDDIVKLRRMQAGSSNLKANVVEGGAVTVKSSKGDVIQINNIHESGDYWIGFKVPEGKRVIIPKFLMDSEMNRLMSRGRNFTKFKRNVKQKLSFIKGFNKKNKTIDVDKAFKSKYKYANFQIKYVMSKNAIADLDVTTLEKISENVYLRALDESTAQILYAEPEELSQEEEEIVNNALEEAVQNDEDFDFENIDEDDLDF